MSRAVPKKAVREAVLKGIDDAYRAHIRMSRRRFMRASEHFISGKIAERLQRVSKDCSVELEMDVEEAMKMAKATKRGPVPASLRANGRFDIALWWKSKGSPRAIIEVKNRVISWNVVASDAGRICAALRRADAHANLQLGCMALFCAAPRSISSMSGAEIALRKLLEDLEDRAQKLAKRKGCKAQLLRGRIHKDKGYDQLRWGQACCIYLRRRIGSEM